MKGTRLRHVFVWMILVLLSAGYFVSHVWRQNNYVELARLQKSLAKQMGTLKSEVDDIEFDNKELLREERLREIASNLGLEYFGLPEFVYSGEEGP